MLSLLEIALGLRAIAAVELHCRDAVVAGEQKLRLADFLGDDQRLVIVAQRGAKFTMALVDLPQYDQRHRQMIALAQPPVEIDRRLRRSQALDIATVGKRAVRHRE